MSTKSKSGLSETPNAKVASATPRISKPVSKGVVKSNNTDSAASPLPNSRVSIDRSPRSVTSKPTVERRSPKLSTPPDKKPARVLKPSELQTELNLAQEDLKKSKEKLDLVEKEKAKALDELNEAQKLAAEANEKLTEALVAQKRAEEDSEIEKFRAVEMEQAGIEAAQKKDEEWEKELESVRSQHALDVAALLSASQELQKAKQELAMAFDAKNQALIHADEATKIAEIHADKVESISAELAHLKSVLDSRVEMEINENDKYTSELKSEIDSLKKELEKAKSFEVKLAEKEAALEQVNVDLEAAKMAESYSRNLVEELHEKVEDLALQAEQAKRLERCASESLESIMKQLEGSNVSLHNAESEISSLKEKVSLLEISIRRDKRDLEELEQLLELAKNEASEMEKKVESLKSELETVKEEKTQALNNEKIASSTLQTILEEKNKLVSELDTSRDEEEKSKKALESLASALHEVSSEARDAKEKLLSSQVEHENYESQIEDLKLVLKATNEKYESLLDDAKQDIDDLNHSIEQSKREYENCKAEWEEKELHLIDSVKKSDEMNFSMENEITRLVNLLKMAEKEASLTREEEDHWKRSCKEAESEVAYLKEIIGESKSESMKLKEGLIDKENEFKNILHENEELRKREEASFAKIEELSKLLEEALSKKQVEENGELTDSEKDYDMLPSVVEFSEQNGTGDAKPKVDSPVYENHSVEKASEMGKPNEKIKDEDSKEVDLKMWESCKIEEKDFSPEEEQEQESFEDKLDTKTEGGESYEQSTNGISENLDNGGSSPTKQSSSQKKKKPLLHKFGNLLKKKSSIANQK
ncbi:hypothetical protein ACJIZ3_022537 [Penstemon smallii]|uniref:Uncharacterized protein n=1 Tax=Penstemon smallii TaxID=265156 RepID=A0ABD3TMU3_9LAMI